MHHALMGGIGLTTLGDLDQGIAGLAFMAGSVLPDLDVVFMAFGKRFYLRHHQGITHSLPLAPLHAIVIAAPLMAATGEGALVYAAALAALWLHTTLDLFNTFRIALFAPFSQRRISLDAVFFIDLPSYVLTGAFYACHAVHRTPWLGVAYLGALALYFGLRYRQQRRVVQDLACDIAIPSSINPFDYYVFESGATSFVTYFHNALTATSRERVEHGRVDPEVLDRARSSPVFRDMESICRALSITQVDRADGTMRIRAVDLAVRNFGGRFGETHVHIAGDGRVLAESANI